MANTKTWTYLLRFLVLMWTNSIKVLSIIAIIAEKLKIFLRIAIPSQPSVYWSATLNRFTVLFPVIVDVIYGKKLYVRFTTTGTFPSVSIANLYTKFVSSLFFGGLTGLSLIGGAFPEESAALLTKIAILTQAQATMIAYANLLTDTLAHVCRAFVFAYPYSLLFIWRFLANKLLLSFVLIFGLFRSATCCTTGIPTLLTATKPAVFLAFVVGKVLRSSRVPLIAFRTFGTTLLRNAVTEKGKLHVDINRLSFSALSSQLSGCKAYIFSHRLITPMLDNCSYYTFFCAACKAEIGDTYSYDK